MSSSIMTPLSRSRRWAVLLAPIVLFLLIVAVLAVGLGRDPSPAVQRTRNRSITPEQLGGAVDRPARPAGRDSRKT